MVIQSMNSAQVFFVWIAVVVMIIVTAVEDDNDDDESLLISESLNEQIRAFFPRAMIEAAEIVEETRRSEAQQSADMRRSGRSTQSTKTFRFVQLFMGSTPLGKHLSFPSLFQSTTLGLIKNRFQLSRAQVRHLMSLVPTILKDSRSVTRRHRRNSPRQCPYPKRLKCNHAHRYRSYDARCNNLIHPLWGSSHQPLVRFLPPDYEDGIGSPRVSSTGKVLPSARTVSATIHWDLDIPHHMHTLMLMQMGQFLDHDMSRTAITKMSVNPTGFSDELEDFECGENGCDVHGLENHPCFPIRILRNDTDYGKGRKRCLMFVRSQEVPNAQCKTGPREQLNQLTAYLDASHIYGSTEKEALDLRELTSGRGRMETISHPAGPYKSMPPIDPKLKMCRGDNRTIFCFKAGDGRVNEFSGLTTQHVIWLREHNRLEELLYHINPHWSGETLYQETRRIITAMWQFCVYSEFLPIILGQAAMDAHGLTLKNYDYWNDYDENIDAGIANSFATAAMRFGHTQLQGIITGRNTAYQPIVNVQLSTQLRRPQLMYLAPHQGMDMMILGLIGQSTQAKDPFITKQVTRHLFSDDPPHGLGEDLMSLNIQRGRDHGLPGYNYFREWCGLKRARHFEELVELPKEVIQRFRYLYTKVDDIDLWPAGISETAAPGSFLGPTFTCILARQFRNLKYGDRFWFENNVHNPHPFTPGQLAEIRKVTYAKVLCINTDLSFAVQPKLFLHPLSKVHENMRRSGLIVESPEMPYLYRNSNNERLPCDRLPSMNMEAWRHRPLNYVHPEVSSSRRSKPVGRSLASSEASQQQPQQHQQQQQQHQQHQQQQQQQQQLDESEKTLSEDAEAAKSSKGVAPSESFSTPQPSYLNNSAQ